MKIVIIDGQGGRVGRELIEGLRRSGVSAELWAIGTNSIATSVMMKAGADYGATGENPVKVHCRDADIIVGPIGIVIADALLGEVTPGMAVAVGQSKGEKILLPVNKCKTHVAGTSGFTLSALIDAATKDICARVATEENKPRVR